MKNGISKILKSNSNKLLLLWYFLSLNVRISEYSKSEPKILNEHRHLQIHKMEKNQIEFEGCNIKSFEVCNKNSKQFRVGFLVPFTH